MGHNYEPSRTDLDDEEPVRQPQGPSQGLTGSGAEMVQVRANVNILGLAVGETGTFPRSDEEVRANIVSGNLSELESASE